MSTRIRAAARRTRLFLVPALAVSGCLLVEPPDALKSHPADGNGGEAGSDAMNAGGSGAASGASGKAGASATAGSAGRATGASGNGDGAGAAGESSGASGGGSITAGAGGSTAAGAGGGSAGQNSGGMHAGGTSGGGGTSGSGTSGGGTAGSTAGATSGGSAGTGGAATVDPYSGPFKILILSTVPASAGFAHDSIADCQAMLGYNSGVANPPAAFNQTPDAMMPTGTKAGSQFTADLATDNLADFTDAKLKNYAMVFSCNPTGTVFSNNPSAHDAATGMAAMAAFQKYVEGGGAWGGVHSATDFEVSGGFPWFTNVLVGAHFVSHLNDGTPGTVQIQSAYAAHPVMKGLSTMYPTQDEWYVMSPDIAALPGFQILATLTLDARPVVWVKELCPAPVGGVCAASPTNGRSFYTIRGHNKTVFKEVEFRQLVLNGILWATHRFKE